MNRPELSELQPHLRSHGRVAFEPLAGVKLQLDLKHPHDRAYAAKLLLGARHPQSDIDELLFCQCVRAGDQVLDAGANIGFTAYELLLAGARRVVAVEPVPEILERLEALNGPLIQVVGDAISSRAGEAEITVSDSHSQGSSLKAEHIALFPGVYGETRKTARVKLTTIDALVRQFGPFDVWKLDIEGAEADAVRGASETLAACPPRAVIAELYDSYFEEFDSLMRRTHPFAYRAFVSRATYALVLKPARTREDDRHVHRTSPMYVYAREKLV